MQKTDLAVKQTSNAVSRYAALAIASVLALVGSAANAAAYDYSTLTSAVDWTSVGTALLAVGVAIIGIMVVFKGIKLVIRAVKGA